MADESRRENQEDERFCPACGELVNSAAVVCAHCGASLSSTTAPQRQTVRSSTGMDPKLVGALSYALTWLTGIIILLIEREDDFVRFHAWQAIAFGGATIAIWFAFFMFSVAVGYIPIVGGFLTGVISFALTIGFLILWILLMVKAYQGKRFKLPVLGDLAENWSTSSTR